MTRVDWSRAAMADRSSISAPSTAMVFSSDTRAIRPMAPPSERLRLKALGTDERPGVAYGRSATTPPALAQRSRVPHLARRSCPCAASPPSRGCRPACSSCCRLRRRPVVPRRRDHRDRPAPRVLFQRGRPGLAGVEGRHGARAAVGHHAYPVWRRHHDARPHPHPLLRCCRPDRGSRAGPGAGRVASDPHQVAPSQHRLRPRRPAAAGRADPQCLGRRARHG